MRTINDHAVNGLNERLEITAHDNPGPGGANLQYTIAGYQNDEPAHRWPGGVRVPFAEAKLSFQNGPIGTVEHMNGISNEALLAVVIDRMRGFQYSRRADGTFDENQRGKFACRENAIALTHLEDALHWLQSRTRARTRKGIEGSHTP